MLNSEEIKNKQEVVKNPEEVKDKDLETVRAEIRGEGEVKSKETIDNINEAADVALESFSDNPELQEDINELVGGANNEISNLTEDFENKLEANENEKTINEYQLYVKKNNLEINGLSQSQFVRANPEIFGERGQGEDGKPKLPEIKQWLADKALSNFVTAEMSRTEEENLENGVKAYYEFLKSSGEADDAFAFSNFVNASPEMFGGEDPNFEKSGLKKKISAIVQENFKNKELKDRADFTDGLEDARNKDLGNTKKS